jgi:hypothetical protein
LFQLFRYLLLIMCNVLERTEMRKFFNI